MDNSDRRKILVTGATGGIGAALVQQLANRHDVIATGRKPEREVRPDLPDNCIYVQADLSAPAEATETIAQALLKAGWTSLDNAILNAGTGYASENGLDTTDIIRTTLDTNLVSSVLLARGLFSWLAKAHGTLTLVGSVAHKGAGLFPAYAASKAGLHGFARALRSEWQGRVSVQIIHPGPTRTEMHQKAGHDPGGMARVFLKPDDVASMISACIAKDVSPGTASFGRYLAGGARSARKL